MRGHSSPSFLWKEVPRRGGAWLTQRNEKKWVETFPPFVIPSAAEGSFSFPVSVFLRNVVCMKHRAPSRMKHGVSRYPPFSLFGLTANEKDFSLSLEMTVRESGILAPLPSHTGKALMRGHSSPSFLWKEVPRRGGAWLTQRNKRALPLI